MYLTNHIVCTTKYGIAALFALYGSVMIWLGAITCFVNGLGELKLQSVFLTIGAIIDVAFTYILARATNNESFEQIIHPVIISFYLRFCDS